jgi:hypothetical protein
MGRLIDRRAYEHSAPDHQNRGSNGGHLSPGSAGGGLWRQPIVQPRTNLNARKGLDARPEGTCLLPLHALPRRNELPRPEPGRGLLLQWLHQLTRVQVSTKSVREPNTGEDHPQLSKRHPAAASAVSRAADQLGKVHASQRVPAAP